MTSALFSDMEGTLTAGSAPRLFVETGRQLGIFSRWEVLRLVALNLLGKPFARSSKIRAQLYYWAICQLVKGHTLTQAEQIAEVMGDELMRRLKPESMELIRQHQKAGRPVIVVSAGGHEAIEAFARKLGAVRGEGTKLELKQGVFTGRGGGLCQGLNKAARVREVAAEMGYNLAECYGYGDTLADVAFLELLGHPMVVDPAADLELVAQQRNWAVVRGNSTIAQTMK